MFVTLSPLWAFVALLAVHWVGDYALQSRWMGDNKSKRLDALSLHVLVYTATLLVGSVALFGIGPSLTFVAVNGAAHFATDFVTSRAVASLWAKKRAYETFLVMGLDQFIHQLTLAATMAWLI